MIRSVGEAAHAALAAGISVVPPMEDGTKRPLGSWKLYQSQRPTFDQVKKWYGDRTGLGFVTGTVSGDLELFELNADFYAEFRQAADAVDLGPLLDRIEAGYLERSPSGGWHLLYRCEGVRGNTKLAQKPGPPDPETGKPTVETLIETRGEGGYVVVAPSNGKVHPSGGRYELLKGGLEHIVEIETEERDQLWALARTFDQMPVDGGKSPLSGKTKVKSPGRSGRGDGPRPGDDFNARSSWDDLLIPQGWKRLYTRGETTYWRRPGKSEGWSATTNHNGSGLLWVFSTSTGFDAERSYDLFGAYVTLEHGGLFEAAAKCLGEQGYGSTKRARDGQGGGGRGGPPPVDAATAGPDPGGDKATSNLAARVRAKVEADGVAGLLRDKGLLAELAQLEAGDPGEFEAIAIELKEVKNFPMRGFRAAVRAAKPVECKGSSDHPYYEKDGGLFVETERMTNFTARIIEEVVSDDGGEETRIEFRIEGVGPGSSAMIAEVKAEEFEAMKWPVAKFGARAIIEAGRGVKEHVRAAIQHLSGEIPRRTVYTHTGWRRIGDEWIYLHAGGGIGAEGLVSSTAVKFDEKLKWFKLPSPPSGLALSKAIRASLRMLHLGQPGRPSSRSLAAVLLAAPYRAAIGDVRHSLKFTGPSGTLKSSAAALAQQHFGARMDHDNLPACWEGTGNGFEGLLHAAKDALVTIDDFAPVGSATDIAREHKTADRIIRSQGNHQGRLRMNADGGMQESKPPRGMILSTGEDGFQKRSANARTLPIQFAAGTGKDGTAGTVDIRILGSCQADARAGLYAASMAAFLRWLAPRYDEVTRNFPARVEAMRPLACRLGAHLRTASIAADLMAALDLFLEFAIEAAAVTEAQANRARQLVWDGLMEAAEEAAAENVDEGTPAERYIGLLVSALISLKAHLVDSRTGDLPPGDLGAACGWHQELRWQGNEDGQMPVWVTAANSTKIGWVDGEFIYLDPDNAYKAAMLMVGGRSDTSIPSMQQIHKQLLTTGKLVRTDARNERDKRGRFTDRVTLEKRRRNVLVIRVADFWGAEEEPAETVEPEVEVEIGESA